MIKTENIFYLAIIQMGASILIESKTGLSFALFLVALAILSSIIELVGSYLELRQSRKNLEKSRDAFDKALDEFHKNNPVESKTLKVKFDLTKQMNEFLKPSPTKDLKVKSKTIMTGVVPPTITKVKKVKTNAKKN